MSALAQLVLAAACQFGQLRHVCTCAVGFGGSFDLEMAEKLSYSKRWYSKRCKVNSEPSHSGSKKRLSLKRKERTLSHPVSILH